MGNNNDRWSALSMKERADLIKLYVSSGITSLDIIKKDYNSFGPGGHKDTGKWKALDKVDFKAIPDSTFTRENTGLGDIEYFATEHPNGITYPNGYHREHPSPGTDVILYNPKTNDEQDIRLDALHLMPKDIVYATLNDLYRYHAKDSDVMYNAEQRYTEDVKKYGKENVDSLEQYFNNEADGLLRNMLIEGTPEYIESKRYYPDKQQLREWNSHLVPYIDAIQQYLETGEKPWYVLEPAVVTAESKKSNGGKLNRFDIGGPTREMTPLEAAALNKTLNNSQYMLAVGDSPEDPAYLSTDVLEPAVVKAFNSEEDYNRYQGEKFGEYVSNEISEAGIKLAPVLVGAAAAPWAISGGIAAYTNPITRSIIDLAGSIDGIRNAASKNGVRKTIRLAKEGDVWGTTKSAIGDIFDIAGGIGAAGDVYRYGKGAAKRLAESVVRIGDMAANSSFLKQQLLNKNAINYILNPFADPNLAYQLPYKYSGEGPQSEASMHAHYGDVVDQYFRKVSVPNTLSKTDVTPGMKHYIETHYPGRDVAYVDLGELKTRPIVFEPTYDLLDGETYKSGLELATLLTVDGKRLDPGGFNYIGTRKGDDLIGTGYDIWKFNAEDYVKKYPGHMNIGVGNKKLKNIIKRFDLNRMIPYYGLKFIDKMGDPVVYKFTHTTPDYYKSIDAFENGGKINRFDSGRKLLTKIK